MKRQKVRILFVLAFAGGVAWLCLLPLVDQAPWWVVVIAVGLALLVLVPAIAFVRGVKWCRPVVAALSLVFLFLWTLSPLAQHAIDRHAGFWVFWALGESMTIGAFWASLKKEPIQAPQRNAGSRPSSTDSSVSETPSSLGPRG